MKYYIFRHAETFVSKNSLNSYEGDNFNAQILYEGKEPIVKLAKFLTDVDSDLNVSSPYERCQETVAIVSKVAGKEFIFDDRIGELYKIDYQGYRKKIEDFLKEVKEKGYQNVIICTHGATMSQLIHLICDKHPEKNIPISEFENTGVLVVIEGGKLKEIDFNSS